MTNLEISNDGVNKNLSKNKKLSYLVLNLINLKF